MIKKLSVTITSLCFMFLVFSTMGNAATKPEFTLKIGNDLPASHPESVCLNDVFKKEVEKNSKGRIKVELYPNGQLGGTREMVESVQMGTLDLTTPTSSPLAGFEPKFQVLDLPFLFKNKDVAWKALDGKLGEKLSALLPSHGFVCLGYFENGYRHISNNRNPIVTPKDLKGLKIRTMENPMHIDYFKALGANPTPMNFGEVYTSLQQKTIDGQENPIAIVWDNKFYEVQKYYSLTGHLFSITLLLMNKDTFDKLPKDLQKVVKDAARKFCLADRKMVSKTEAGTLAKIKKTGMKVNELNDAQKKPFIDAAKPIYEKYKSVIGTELFKLAMDANK